MRGGSGVFAQYSMYIVLFTLRNHKMLYRKKNPRQNNIKKAGKAQ